MINQMLLLCLGDVQRVGPEFVKVLELVRVQEDQNDHRIDDDNQPEDVHKLLPCLSGNLKGRIREVN